jgi:hypothetical protein
MPRPSSGESDREVTTRPRARQVRRVEPTTEQLEVTVTVAYSISLVDPRHSQLPEPMPMITIDLPMPAPILEQMAIFVVHTGAGLLPTIGQ